MLPEPPPGWDALQREARCAKDAKQLAAIIDAMNKLLSDYEKRAGGSSNEKLRRSDERKMTKKKAR